MPYRLVNNCPRANYDEGDGITILLRVVNYQSTRCKSPEEKY